MTTQSDIADIPADVLAARTAHDVLTKEERVRYQRLLNAHDPNHI